MIGTTWGREAVLNTYFKNLQIIHSLSFILLQRPNPASFWWQQGWQSHNITVINFSYWLVEKMVLCWCQVQIGHWTGWAKLNLEGRLISSNGGIVPSLLTLNKIFWVPINFSLTGIPTYFLTRALRAGIPTPTQGKSRFVQRIRNHNWMLRAPVQ